MEFPELKAVISYPKRIVSWVWQGRYVYSGFLFGVCLPVLVVFVHPDEISFRLIGFFLQVLGVWTVWVGIRGTREQFEVPGWFAETKAWLSSFPRPRGRVVHAALMGLEVGVDIASMRAYAWHGTAPDVPVEQRIEAIEKNLRNVREELSAYQKESDERARAHADEMKRERAEREAAVRSIHEKIKETETGGVKLNAAGVWWLFSGTVCSTFPKELSDAIAWIAT